MSLKETYLVMLFGSACLVKHIHGNGLSSTYRSCFNNSQVLTNLDSIHFDSLGLLKNFSEERSFISNLVNLNVILHWDLES